MFTKALFIDNTLISENSLNEILNSFFYSESGNSASSSGAIHREDIEFFGDTITVAVNGGNNGDEISNDVNIRSYTNEISWALMDTDVSIDTPMQESFSPYFVANK